eukprot:5949778-Pyramimonas_sp.AAC.1
MELHRRPQWQGSHGGLGPFWRAPREDRGPIGAPPKAPEARFAWRPRAILAHPSRGSWPHI